MDLASFSASASTTDIGLGPAFAVRGSVRLRPLPPPFRVVDGAMGKRYMLHLQAYLIAPSGLVVWSQKGFPQGGAWVDAGGAQANFSLIDAYSGPTAGHTVLIVAAGDPVLSDLPATRVLLGADEFKVQSKPKSKPPALPAAPVGTPAHPVYAVANEVVSDTPIKTQVEQHVVVSGKPTAAQVEQFLRSRWSEISCRTGYRYHDNPTNVYIYVYETKQQALAGRGLWLGMLQMGPLEKGVPAVTLRKDQIPLLGSPPETRFRLTEARRKKVYRELLRAEHRSTTEATKRFPSDIMKQINCEDELLQKYRSQLLETFSLTEKQLTEIAIEGIKKRWPA